MNKHIPAAAGGIVLLGLALGSGAGTASAAGTAGTRDATFGSGGIVVTNLGADPFGNAIQGNVSAAALQSDGDIVVSVVNAATGDSGLLRYLPNGTRDTTFGNGGFAAFPADANPSTVEGEFDGRLVRFNANGSVDQSFGTGGQVLVRNDPFTTLGLDASADIFTLSVNPGATTAARLEFSPAGRQDASVTPAAITASSRGSLADFLPSGGFVISGEAFPDGFKDGDLQVRRYHPDGSLASATAPFDWGKTIDPRSDGAGALAIQANGQALVSEGGFQGAQKVARYNADGSFAAGFGTGSVASTQVRNNDSAAVLLTQPAGKILATGSAQNTTTGVVDVLLVRYLAS